MRPERVANIYTEVHWLRTGVSCVRKAGQGECVYGSWRGLKGMKVGRSCQEMAGVSRGLAPTCSFHS